MYCELNKAYIQMVRGDSLTLELPLYVSQGYTREIYSPVSSDILYVGIMQPNQSFEVATIRKKLEASNTGFILKLEPTDTVNLEPGKYFLSAKFVQGSDVITVLNMKEFWIDGTYPKRSCDCL